MRQSDGSYDSIQRSNWMGTFFFSGQANSNDYIGCEEFNVNINGTDYQLSPPITTIILPRTQIASIPLIHVKITEGNKQLEPGDYDLEAVLISKNNNQVIYHLDNKHTSIPIATENPLSAILIPQSNMRNIKWARADTEVITIPEILILLN